MEARLHQISTLVPNDDRSASRSGTLRPGFLSYLIYMKREMESNFENVKVLMTSNVGYGTE
jgi:hypothetical protein